MRDVSAADPLEALAREKGVTYVKLDGEVGILGNGAGLVMSTLDVIALAGGKPANFCDLGGGGDAEGVVDALEVILQRPAGEVDPLQHLRRHHPLRRGGARHPRGARADDDRAADRRPPGRHERRGGADGPRRRGARRTSTSSRRCSTRRAGPWSSRVMSDWSSRARGLPRTPRSSGGRGPRPDREWAEGVAHGAGRRDRRRARGTAAARGGAPGRQLRSRARDAARRDLPRGASSVRGRRLRPRRHRGSRRTTSTTSPPPSPRWRASATTSSSSRTRST